MQIQYIHYAELSDIHAIRSVINKHVKAPIYLCHTQLYAWGGSKLTKKFDLNGINAFPTPYLIRQLYALAGYCVSVNVRSLKPLCTNRACV